MSPLILKLVIACGLLGAGGAIYVVYVHQPEVPKAETPRPLPEMNQRQADTINSLRTVSPFGPKHKKP